MKHVLQGMWWGTSVVCVSYVIVSVILPLAFEAARQACR